MLTEIGLWLMFASCLVGALVFLVFILIEFPPESQFFFKVAMVFALVVFTIGAFTCSYPKLEAGVLYYALDLLLNIGMGMLGTATAFAFWLSVLSLIGVLVNLVPSRDVATP